MHSFSDHLTRSRATVTPPGKWRLTHLVSSSCAKEPSQPTIVSEAGNWIVNVVVGSILVTTQQRS